MPDLAARLGVPPKLVGGVVLGTLLNPLNSSMISVALISLQHSFEVSVATSTWLVSAFYLAAAIGQPLMGRMVDLFGARRLFIAGLFIVLAVSALAPFAPNFWSLVALRAIQGLGTSAAYPSALVLFRAATPSGRPPSGALAVLGIVASSSAALGPVLGGVLIWLAGWPAIFMVNLPLAIAGATIAFFVLPRNPPTTQLSARALLRVLDLPGVALFAATIATLLMFLLSLARDPSWWFLPVSLGCLLGLVFWELSTDSPFLDVRGIAANRALGSLLLQQAATNTIFYSVFFGLPMWLEAVRGIPVEQVGGLLLPFTIMSLFVTPVTARMIDRRGVWPLLIFGAFYLLVSSLGIQLLGDMTPVLLILVFASVMGVPNGLNNLALQTGLFAASPPERIGSSAGLFQTGRYLGAILASSILGVLLERNLSTEGLHHVGWVTTVAAVLLVGLAFLLPRTLGRP